MKLYLDEHFSTRVAVALRQRGIDAISTDEAHNKGLTDEEVLEFCVTHNRHLLTRDLKDFAPLAAEWIRRESVFPTILLVTASIRLNDFTALINSIEAFIDSTTSNEHFPASNSVFYLGKRS